MSTKSASQELFRLLPGFLEAVRQIGDQGFFESFTADITSHEGQLYTFTLKGVGCIPSHPKYQVEGVEPLIDVNRSVASVQEQVEEGDLKVTRVICTVDTANWDRWDRAELRVTGSKGSKIVFALSVTFDLKAKPKKRK